MAAPSPTFLVVEDDLGFRDTVEDILVDEGHRVLTARDGLEALSLLPRLARPALILLDMQMPRMDGVAFLARLRELPDVADFEVVVMSASVHGDWFRFSPAVVRSLRKPFDTGEIERIASEFVARHPGVPRPAPADGVSRTAVTPPTSAG